MNHQYERILGILTGQSDESAIAINQTEVDWAGSCDGISYSSYGRTLEEVMIRAFAFSVNSNFPKDVSFSAMSSEWQIGGAFYRLSAVSMDNSDDSYQLSLVESEEADFRDSKSIRLPYKWVGRMSKGEVLVAFENYKVQVSSDAVVDRNLVTFVDFTLEEIVDGSVHKLTARNDKILSWEFPNGRCDLEMHEPIYRNISRCSCS